MSATPRQSLAFPRRARLKSPLQIRAILNDSGALRRRWPAFRLIGAPPVAATDQSVPQFAFVASRDVGTAVVRNRAKRRLREAVRLSRETWPPAGTCCVFRIHDDRAATVPFGQLLSQVQAALEAMRTKSGEAQ